MDAEIVTAQPVRKEGGSWMNLEGSRSVRVTTAVEVVDDQGEVDESAYVVTPL